MEGKQALVVQRALASLEDSMFVVLLVAYIDGQVVVDKKALHLRIVGNHIPKDLLSHCTLEYHHPKESKKNFFRTFSCLLELKKKINKLFAVLFRKTECDCKLVKWTTSLWQQLRTEPVHEI